MGDYGFPLDALQSKLSKKLQNYNEQFLELKAIKSPREVAHLRKAHKITSDAMREGCAAIREGVSENKIAGIMNGTMMSEGAHDLAFFTMVVSGPRSSLKHGYPTERKMKRGDLVYIDMGASYHGYVADMSRTLTVGSPNPKQKEILDKAYDIHKATVKMMRPGASCSEIADRAYQLAREVNLEKDTYVGGHGLGTTLFDLPVILPKVTTRLAKNMIFAYEPMIIPMKLRDRRSRGRLLGDWVRRGKAYQIRSEIMVASKNRYPNITEKRLEPAGVPFMLKQPSAVTSRRPGVFTLDTQVYPWHCPIPVVYVEGSSTEMGRQFGKATRNIIRKIVAFNAPSLEKLLKQCKISKKDHLSTTESVVSKFTESEYLDELSATAEAAGVSYEALLLTNTNIDLIYELPSPESHGPLFCNFFSAWGDATKDRQSLVAGHNDDGGRYMDQFLVLKIAKPQHGFPFVNPIVPGTSATTA